MKILKSAIESRFRENIDKYITNYELCGWKLKAGPYLTDDITFKNQPMVMWRVEFTKKIGPA